MIHYGPGQNIIDLSGVLTYQVTRSTGAAAAGAIVYDTFTAADGSDLYGHLPDISSNGAVWDLGIDLSGAFIYSNKVCSPDTTPMAGTILTAASDCTISAVFVLPTGSSGMSVALLFRCTNNSNYWRFEWTKASNAIRIVEKTSGSSYNRATGTVTYDAGGTHTLSVVLLGNDITAYLDGVQKLTYSSSIRSTSKLHGFNFAQPNFDGSMDEFTITTGGGAPSTAGYAMGVLGLTYSS